MNERRTSYSNLSNEWKSLISQVSNSILLVWCLTLVGLVSSLPDIFFLHNMCWAQVKRWASEHSLVDSIFGSSSKKRRGTRIQRSSLVTEDLANFYEHSVLPKKVYETFYKLCLKYFSCKNFLIKIKSYSLFPVLESYTIQ